MVDETQLLSQLLMMFSEMAILSLLVILLFLMVLVGMILLSIKHEKYYYPRLLRVGFKFMDGVVRNICRLVGVDDRALTVFFIRLHNSMSEADFAQVEIKDRAIFLPHCLRSTECPAHLTTEGLICEHCGRCELDHTVNELEAMGYKVFIVPGSTFIGRMVKKYLPRAIIGIGCIREVREGLEFADRIGVIVMGVINKTDGCVETLADLPELLKVASLGTHKL